jgi:hypothetical protein
MQIQDSTKATWKATAMAARHPWIPRAAGSSLITGSAWKPCDRLARYDPSVPHW